MISDECVDLMVQELGVVIEHSGENAGMSGFMQEQAVGTKNARGEKWRQAAYRFLIAEP